MASGLLDKANIILTPTGYKAGTMYNVAPIEQPYEDFDFARASVASRVNSSGLVEMVGRTLGSNLVQNGDFSELGTDLVQNGTFDLGSELVTNGDYSESGVGNATSQSGGVLVNENNKLKITSGGGAFARAVWATGGSAGDTFVVEADIISISGSVRFYDESNNGTYADLVAGSTYKKYIVLGSAAKNLGFGGNNDVNFELVLDNVSVKEVPDWTLGTGWSVENNKAIYSGTANANLSQSGILTSSKQYKLEYEVISSTLVGGIVKLSGETASAQNVLSQSVGTHTLYFTADGTSPTDLNIRVVINTAGQYEITNVVIKQLDPNDYWTFSGGNITINDEGCRINRISSTTFIQQNVLTSGKVYKVEFDVLDKPDNSGTFIVRLGSNNVYDVVTYEGTRFSEYITSAGIDFRIYSSSNNGVIYVDNIVVQEVIDTNNIPRINYDSNGENGHWLLEPTSTNLIVNNNNSFTPNKTSITYNNINSPEGIQNAFKVEATATGTSIYVRTTDITFTDATFSVFVKYGNNQWLQFLSNQSANHYFNFDVQNGVFGINGTSTSNLKATDFGNGWYRVSGTFTGNTGLCQLRVYLSNASGVGYGGATATSGDFFYSYGWQAEALSYPTSYIPTLTGSTETRATETANGAGSADLINSTEGVLYAEIAALANDGTNRTIALNKDTNDRIQMYFNTSTNGLSIFYKAQSGATSFIMNETLTDATSFNKIAFKWKANDFALWVNGVETDTVSSGVTPTANSLNALEFEMFNNASPFYGKCKALTVFNTALTDAELTELTS